MRVVWTRERYAERRERVGLSVEFGRTGDDVDAVASVAERAVAATMARALGEADAEQGDADAFDGGAP